jgi:hypothetical protein
LRYNILLGAAFKWHRQQSSLEIQYTVEYINITKIVAGYGCVFDMGMWKHIGIFDKTIWVGLDLHKQTIVTERNYMRITYLK